MWSNLTELNVVEINFFRQAPSAPYGKMWSPKSRRKVSIKFFLRREHKPKFLVPRWKILVANFSFKNQNEENAFVFGAPMAIYTPTTEKPRRMNRMPAIYAVS